MNMLSSPAGSERISPAIQIADPGTNWWVGQATLRLRREIAWRRHLNPPHDDPTQNALDLLRHEKARETFLITDPACRFLEEKIAVKPPGRNSVFSRMAARANLSKAECFVLALALAARIDGEMGPVFSACQNNAERPWPTLALAQSLWEDPLAVLAAQEPARPLRAFGLLLEGSGATLTDPLIPCPGLARYLCGTTDPTEFGLDVVTSATAANPALRPLATRLSGTPESLEIVPIIGPAQGDSRGLMADFSALGARQCVICKGFSKTQLHQVLLLAWLMDADILLTTPMSSREQVDILAPVWELAALLRLRVFLHFTSQDMVRALPPGRVGPVATLPVTTPKRRAALLRTALGRKARAVNQQIDIVAREYQLDPGEITRISASLRSRPGVLAADRLIAACRTECSIDFQGLAEPLAPRFTLSDIVLPPAATHQFNEALAAIRGAGRLQHEWGGAKAYGDGGISLLFTGVPGTGKTMGAQVLAHELDLPLFRIDLSQVVNKYIGETEKNLKRIFDVAEKMRCILFFDEAEALFGKRTEVKDANDRFANMETGYLLQRMETFTGIAVLATNRRKDMDEAFTRRLRYIIEFPVPGADEREKIWSGVFPTYFDLTDLDLTFLAGQFQLSGGHIRSIAFNACLQVAARESEPRMTMRDVLIATKREFNKLNRTSGSEIFGPWYNQIGELRE